MPSDMEKAMEYTQKVQSGKTCATCTQRDDPYGDCPFEPNNRSQRPMTCHKYREW